jgi:site-specific DNA-methyltransferase (adenine-specific)
MTRRRGFQLLPEPSPAEYAALKRDISAHGVVVPVEVDEDGTTLDGHTRLRIVDELRVEGVKVPDYPRVVRRFKTREEKIGHVLALNLARRHLSRQQRGELVTTLRQEHWSNRRIAEVLGVDEATVRRDHSGAAIAAPAKVKGKDGRQYPATRPKGTPSIVAGTAREEARARKALDMLGDEAPGRLLQLGRAETKAREASLARYRAREVPKVSKGRKWRVEHCDFRELDIAERSVDAIICDPPYTDADIPIFSELSEFAARVLKPGRLLAAYCGKLRQPEEMARLAEHLEYVWIGATVLRGRHTKVHVHKINGWHRPWLLYSKGRYRPRGWIKDTIVAGEGAGEKQLTDHHWKQAEGPIRELISMLTVPGELVCDPFLGSGTTAAAAISVKRRFVGCDVDPAAVAMTLERLEKGDN